MTKRSVYFVAGVAAMLGLGGPALQTAQAMDVPLKVQETADVARSKDPCRSGIPLVPGAVKEETRLRVLDAHGAEVPAQFRVINRRPAGDIEWVSVAFLADVPANGTAVYRLTDSGPAKAVDKPVTVKESADTITLMSGPLKLVVSKKSFSGLGQVWLDRDGDGAFADTELVSKGGALTIKGMDGKVYSSVSDLTGPLSVTMEESGPLHAVVRIDGQMRVQTADGKEHFYPTYDQGKRELHAQGVKLANKDGSLGFTVRLHVWKDQTWVRAFVTMRNLAGMTSDWTEQRIQFGDYFAQTSERPGNWLVDAVNLDLDLNAAGNLKYRIGGGNEGTEVHAGDLAESKGSVMLYQDSSAGWVWQAGTGKVWDDRLKKNIEFMKNTWREKAKAKGEDPEAAAAKAPAFYEYSSFIFNELMRKRDGASFMGYRLYKGGAELTPGSSSSFADLGKEAGEGLRAPGWIEADDGKVVVTAGCRWFWQMLPKSLELRAPGRLSVGLWSQYLPRGHVFEGKIHKTHELVFDFRPSGKGLDGQARFLVFTQRLVATPDPRHNLASRVYGDFMLPNSEEWPTYEKSALMAVVSCLDQTKNPGMASSIEIEREKCDHYDMWRFGDSPKDSWHYFGQYQELDVPYCLMVHYARTGDLRFYRVAEEVGRMLLDIPAHGGGYGHQKGEPSHYYAYGPLLYADVAAEPFLRDAVHYSHEIVNPKPWHLRSFAITMWSNWAMYNGFEADRAAWRAGMDVALKWWAAAQRSDGAMGGMDRRNQVFFLGLGSDAMGRYGESFPEDKASREALVRAMREWMEHVKSLPEDQKKAIADMAMEKTCANGFAFASRFSGDPAFLEFAAANMVKDAAFPTQYRNGVCSAKMWSETLASHRLIQVFMHDIDKKRHPDKYKDLP